ncbi:MAG: hypothetical protein ABI624_02605, partial [Casimicrobiaceae bacterium]
MPWGRPFTCGPFTGACYEGTLRWLAVEGFELVRTIALVVRDRTWRTLPPTSLRVRQSTEGWSIHGRTRVDAAVLRWRMLVTGAPSELDVRV